MSEGVEGPGGRVKPQFPAQSLHIAQDVIAPKRHLSPISKQEILRFLRIELTEPEGRLPPLDADRDDSLLPSLAIESQETVVEVNVPESDREGLAYSASRVEQELYEEVESFFAAGARLPGDQASNLQPAVCRSTKLGSFRGRTFNGNSAQ